MKRLPMWVEEQQGLRFACTRCGDCCHGEDGYVWVGDEEIAGLARHLDMPLKSFAARYLRVVDGMVALVDRPHSRGACVFWADGQGCVVYEARPEQCKTFPFWPEHIRSPRSWERLAQECPGVARGQGEATGARLYAPDEIRAMLGGAGQTDAGVTP